MEKDFSYNPEDSSGALKRELEYKKRREEWLEEGKTINASYFFVMYDRVEKEYYPVFISDKENLEGKKIEYSHASMQTLKEVVDVNTGQKVE